MNKDMATKITAKANVASGNTLDCAGAESGVLILNTAAGTTVTLTEGDDSGGVGATAVDAKFIIPTPAAGDVVAGVVAGNVVTYAAAGTAIVGYVGKKQYLTVAIGTPAVDTTIVFVKGELHNRPQGS
jgi:hypothetical protein